MVTTLEEFARSRGFTETELKEYELRVEDGHVIIPILGRAGPWFERLRCDMGCHTKYWQPPGTPSHLFNPLGLGPHSGEVWLAEGELDTLSLLVSGVPALGVLGAGNFNRHWYHLFSGAEVVIAFDSDEAGDSQAERLAQLWPAEQVSRFDPSPYADVNEWFVTNREEFTEAVQGW
jgi:DNA primase